MSVHGLNVHDLEAVRRWLATLGVHASDQALASCIGHPSALVFSVDPREGKGGRFDRDLVAPGKKHSPSSIAAKHACTTITSGGRTVRVLITDAPFRITIELAGVVRT